MVKFQLGKRIDRFLINQIGVNEVHLYSSSALGSVKAGLDATKVIGKGGDRLIEISEAISSKAPITANALASAGSILKLSELPPQFIQIYYQKHKRKLWHVDEMKCGLVVKKLVNS